MENKTKTETEAAPAVGVRGTHNSMTFLRPARWYGYFMLPFARCQSKTLRGQYDAGARCFDLRVRFHKNGMPVFAHGLLELRGGVRHALARLNALARRERLSVRLILEDTKSLNHNEDYFILFCSGIEKRYPRLDFFGGFRKGDWKRIVDFGEEPELVQQVGSMAADARPLEKIVPRLYALRRNKANMEAEKEGAITIYDFI